MLDRIIQQIKPLDSAAMTAAQNRQNVLTKPQGSLGKLEELSIKVAGIQANPRPHIQHKAIVTMAAEPESLLKAPHSIHRK